MSTQTTLLDHAETLARTRGYDAFSFADLARHAKIAKPSVHHHFPTKGSLAIALVTRYAARVAAELDDIAGTAPTPRACLERFVALYRDTGQNGRALCLCVAFGTSRDSFDEDVLEALAAYQSGVLAWLRAAFAAHGWSQAEAEGCLALCEGAQVLARTARDIALYDAATGPFLKRLAETEE
ncbi:TetR/AcrR family transcriptional regulator [Pseudaestuariivita atlantica]|uniref:HTH tetR-type domain-containing protein n=1 Tax=Pseudaestuariivita atlantica TaxID=1317121 RepID=A0A0L1JND8_9RHOB|nr:TetR/AcrR family transcriptional regulator [Pseudaestuariivita atlantica]KNG93227.1 hypothetical protein ATO11_12265 [Pseudaestuariivita atlantica]